MRILFASLFLLVPPACAAVAGAAPGARVALSPAAALAPALPPALQPALPAALAPAQLAAQLFERDWQWQLRHAPERATALGEHGYNAYLSDTSLAARALALEHARAMLAAGRQIERSVLGDQDRLSLDLFIADQQQVLAQGALHNFDPQPISAWDGLQVQLPRLVAQMPFATEADYQTYLMRLQAVPAHVAGLIEQLRAGRQAGWSTPKVVIAPVPEALRLLREGLQDGPLGAPFQRIPAAIAPEVRTQLRAAGAAVLAETVAPSLRQLEDYLRQDYLPGARASIGASSQAGGADWYAHLVRTSTSSALTPAQIHALGLQEVARLRAAIERLIPRTGFRGGFAEFLVFARSDRRLFFNDPNELLERYRRTLALAQARLARVVSVMPAAGIVVKPMGANSAGQPAAYYEAGSAQRTAALVVDTAQLAARPMWQVDALVLHEAVPGHHLQVARAQELDLPAFRRHGWYDAFGEGWATYAEGLGPALGLFKDPFSQFGQLNEEMFRAARLVVDTGIHTLGWSRQQALDFLAAHTANPASDNEAEVDRYIARPAQALSYKIGQLRLLALRNKAHAALGSAFDVRRFHDALLGNGALPLAQLERQIAHWIVAENNPAPAVRPDMRPDMPPNMPPDMQPETLPDDAFNAGIAHSAPLFEPAFEFDFAFDGEVTPGAEPGPAPDFVPPANPAPPPGAASYRTPPWRD